jgi:hypothetical protein
VGGTGGTGGTGPAGGTGGTGGTGAGGTGGTGGTGSAGPGTLNSGISGQVAFYTGTTVLSGSVDLTFVPSTKVFTCGGDIVAFSDARKKKNIQKITDALSKIRRINGYTYEFIDIMIYRRNAGVLAHEIREVLPELVHDNDDGTMSVAYGNMASLFIEAIKELEARVTELEKKLSDH